MCCLAQPDMPTLDTRVHEEPMEPNQIRAKRIADGNEIRVIFGARASYSYLMEAVLDDEDKPEGRKTYRTGALIPVKAPAEVFGILRQAV